MNGKKRSDKDLLHLGLPPMELAEPSVTVKSSTGLKKYLELLPKFIAIIILIVVAIGSYFTLLGTLQSIDFNRNTEIIIVTGLNEPTNATANQNDLEVILHILNTTSESGLKRGKRNAISTSEIETDIDINKFTDEQMQKARKLVTESDINCKNENIDELCKDIVTKINSIAKKPLQINENEAQSVPVNAVSFDNTKSTTEIKHGSDLTASSTDKGKRETFPVTHIDLMKSTPHMHFDGREEERYSNDPSHLQIQPQQLADTCLLARLLKDNYPNLHGVYDAPAPEYLPPPFENQPLPYARYQLPPFVQGRESNPPRPQIHPQDEEIFMKFFTPKPDPENSSNSTKRDVECPTGTIPCNNGESCVAEKNWCDGNVDCSDVSDESRCSCKSRVDKARICDGYFDCPFGEDEMGCFGCSESTFSCGDVNMNSQSTCFTEEQRCNNIAECPNHRDEVECTMLAPSLSKKPLFAISNTEGFLHRNFKGTWYPVCKNPYMWAHDACRRETGLIIRPPFIQMLPIDPMLQVTYLNTGPGGMLQMSNTCFNSSAVYVTCPDLLCGTRVLSTSQLLRENAAIENELFGRNKRFLYKSHPPYSFMFYGGRIRRSITNTINNKNPIRMTSTFFDKNSDGTKIDNINEMRNKRAESRVVGGRPSQPAAWPWVVAMYRDGMFHCGGVIITQRWIVSAAHCVQNFWEHYFEIQVGMLRRFSFSPQEQNHVVTHVIVNHQYSKVDMKNDLSLLRVKPAIIFSRWVRPICLPGPETAGADWKWGPAPGTMCIAVGWGATKEHGPDPDHMREVEIPIWARCKHQEDKDGKEICAGPVEGGKDACQGDSGGPLICKNPLNSQQWYMAGIVSHGDGCARKDEPGVYTRVSLFVKWIRHHIFSKTLPTIQPKQECPGFKCTSGIPKCIPVKRVCDKIVDCLNGEDELNCSVMRSTHTFENTFLISPFGDSMKKKEAEINLPLVEKLSNNLVNSNTAEIFTSTHVPATIDTSSETRESSNTDKNTGGNPNTDNTLKPELDMNTTLSAHKEKSVSEINFAHTSTIEMPNSKSSDNSDIVSNSAEHVTADPNRSTLSEEMERTNRGDMETFTVINSRESLDSRSSVTKNKKSKEADIHEDWSDTDSSSVQNVDSSTTTPTMKSSIIQADELTATSTPANHKTIESNSLNENNQNQHMTLMENENSKPESKDFSRDLLPDTQTTMSTHTNDVPHTEILNMSNSDAASAKIIEDVEDKHGLIDKIKGIVSSHLQPAKTRKEHRVPKDFECRRILQNVPYYQRCDHKADCEDGTDELGCTCTDYLTVFDKNLICDGIFDCADGQDEIDCYTCPEDQFLCKRSQQCLPSKYVCDGELQCPQGEDELGCFALSNGKNIVYDIDGRPKVNLEGYLTKKHINDWQIVCEDMSREKQELAATHICRYLGFSSANRYLVKYINVKEDEILKAKSDDTRSKRHINEVPIHFAYRKVEEDTARHIVIKEPQVLKEQCVPNVTKTCMSLYVFCDQALFMNVDVPQELYFSREVENTENMWPWTAKVYVEGDYRCTGVLIDLSWVLISHSCLWDTLLSHHITVVLGSQRTLSLTPGMYEQIYQVDAKKDLYRSKVALLHLKEQAHYSSMVKPMVLPTSNMQISSKSVCVAIGQNYKNTTMGVFLQETSENCDLHSRCFKRLRQDETFCAPGVVINRPWAGIISCHTDQGWFPAASFVVAEGECRVADRIVASEIENLKNEMRQYLGRSVNSKEAEASDECDGQRCGRGQCIKLGLVCDGVKDCHDEKDESEAACEKKENICTKNPYHKGCECSASQLKCHNGKCVAKELFGDGRDDCGDGTDEPAHMTCSHYLARVKPSRLCDGVLHCADRSDEDPMYCKCFAKQTYKCPSVSDTVEHCVAPDMVCDGVRDCPDGGDERVCVGLSAPEGTAAGTGQVMIRSHGVWHSKCYPTPNHTRSELEDICKELGFIGGHAKQLDPPDHSAFRPSNNLILDSFSEVMLNNNTRIKIRNTNEPMARATVDDTLENCHPVFIECL